MLVRAGISSIISRHQQRMKWWSHQLRPFHQLCKSAACSLLHTGTLLSVMVCSSFIWSLTNIALAAESSILPQPSNVISLAQLPRLNTADIHLKQRTMVLLFTPQCNYCKQQLRHMEQLKMKCPTAQMALVGVQANKFELQSEIRRLTTDLPAFIATAAFLRAIQGFAAVPTSLFFDADGRLLLKHRGMLTHTQLSETALPFLAPSCDEFN
jgi:thiol-disulfide isomerase/thioredoxin